MAPWLIAATGAVYVVVAVDLFRQGSVALAFTYVGYAIGNVGLYFVASPS
jgi:hypothetical protein